jgi:RNA polymerase sigma-70 factor (ECF subfamily)
MSAGLTVEELFVREFPRLTRALAVAFGDAEAAADAVQEAFIEADRRWGTLGRYEDPAGWVRRVATNRLINQRRNRRRRTEILRSIRSIPPDELTDDLFDLRASIGQLPEKQRVAVCLHYLAGYGIDEIAEILDVTAGTVKSNLFDARQRLRQGAKEEPHA